MNAPVQLGEGGLITPSLFRRHRQSLLEKNKGPDWQKLLLDLANAARDAVTEAQGKGRIQEHNAKGDVRHAMDLAAQAAVLRILEQSRLPLRLLSEENEGAGMIDFGASPPLWQIVVDPLDGTDNAARGLPLSAFTAAILPMGATLSPLNVIAAVIAPMPDQAPPFLLINDTVEHARPAPVDDLHEALITVELNHFEPQGAFARLLKQVRGVRCYGCCSRAHGLMLSGATQAHIDVRDRLTPESWLAAAAMILASNGAVFIGDATLNPRPAPTHLLDKRSLIAASSPNLLKALLSTLKEDEGS